MKFFTRLFSLAVIATALVTLPACNTMEGAGEDIQKGGEKLENAAEKNK